MLRLELYPFRFLGPLTGKWVRARYKASAADLQQRYGEGRYEVTGPPEIREVDAEARYFNPLRDECWPKLRFASISQGSNSFPMSRPQR